ncbi:hypothetical protein V7S43_007871 [Phytophthora oleae]|uniref:Uncharacterized protein n=1 Tax=Phytophthora oleae TaxID=2107226 RepID=A0ABD3FMW4_9STRA
MADTALVLLDDAEDLAGALESYTRELGALCRGLELEQHEAEDDDLDEDVCVGLDTLSSLEEITGECAALLACLEAEEHSSDEEDECPEVEDNQKQPVKELTELPRPETELAHELDSFADELNEFLSCLGEADKVETYSPPQATQPGEEKLQNEEDSSASAAPVVSTIAGEADGSDEAGLNEVFSERTKKAITLHIKRLALQTQHRNGSRLEVPTYPKDVEAPTQQDPLSGGRVVWSRFQSSSFKQHIFRQKFARRRLQQIKETQRLVESARLKGPKPKDLNKSSNQATPRPTYLSQFKNPVPSSDYEPRYLCAVYLYGHRRLGTTYITFSSLSQLEKRIRARFSIEQVAGIYREVTEILPDSTRRRSNKLRAVKRLKRISTLENVTDSDTLCVTQNAYDDMTILCDWIKQRQCLVHNFEFKVRQAPSDASSDFTHNGPTPPNSKINMTTKPQLWDSNGRSIGVNAQHTLRSVNERLFSGL